MMAKFTGIARFRSALFLLSILSASIPLTAGPVAVKPVRYVVAEADSIVIGSGSHVVTSGPVVAFQFAVERVLKGSVAPGANISITWTRKPGFQDFGQLPSFRAILFLSERAGGYDLVPAATGNTGTLVSVTFLLSNRSS